MAPFALNVQYIRVLFSPALFTALFLGARAAIAQDSILSLTSAGELRRNGANAPETILPSLTVTAPAAGGTLVGVEFPPAEKRWAPGRNRERTFYCDSIRNVTVTTA